MSRRLPRVVHKCIYRLLHELCCKMDCAAWPTLEQSQPLRRSHPTPSPLRPGAFSLARLKLPGETMEPAGKRGGTCMEKKPHGCGCYGWKISLSPKLIPYLYPFLTPLLARAKGNAASQVLQVHCWDRHFLLFFGECETDYQISIWTI